jgi:hypothetical protein
MGEPGLVDVSWSSVGGHVSAAENLIFDLACAGQSPFVHNDRLSQFGFEGAFGREGSDQVVVIKVELGPIFRKDEVLLAAERVTDRILTRTGARPATVTGP